MSDQSSRGMNPREVLAACGIPCLSCLEALPGAEGAIRTYPAPAGRASDDSSPQVLPEPGLLGTVICTCKTIELILLLCWLPKEAKYSQDPHQVFFAGPQ